MNRIEFETVLNTGHSLTTKERQEIFKKCRIAHGKYSFQGVYNNEISNNEISNNEIDDNENTNEMTQERQFIVHQETVVSNESEVELNLDVKSFIPHKDSTYVSYGFHSQLKTAMPAEMVESLMGHEGYLSGAYRRYSVEQLQAEYDKACHLVSLHSAENLPAIKSDLQNQREVMQAVVADNQRMRVEMEEMQKFLRAVQQSGLLNRG